MLGALKELSVTELDFGKTPLRQKQRKTVKNGSTSELLDFLKESCH